MVLKSSVGKTSCATIALLCHTTFQANSKWSRTNTYDAFIGRAVKNYYKSSIFKPLNTATSYNYSSRGVFQWKRHWFTPLYLNDYRHRAMEKISDLKWFILHNTDIKKKRTLALSALFSKSVLEDESEKIIKSA